MVDVPWLCSFTGVVNEDNSSQNQIEIHCGAHTM